MQPRLKMIHVALFVFLQLTFAHGHDFWLASSPWNVPPGKTITLTANVGDDTFPVSQNYTSPDRIEFVTVVGSHGGAVTPQFRRLDNSLAADILLPPIPNTYVVVMSVKGRFLSMAPDKFESYVKEEGLDDVITERSKRGEANKPSRERYRRQAKTLVDAGEGLATEVTRPTELVAELVPDTDLTKERIGNTVGVRLLYRGQPVKGAQITLTSSAGASDKSQVIHRRSDSDGRAQFTVVGHGPYLLASVVMVRREGETGPEAADWESYWCSLTFNLRDAK